jgi:hypothetical protein
LGFRFEAFWTKIDGFNEVVQQAWTSSVRSSDAILRLHVKMTCTAKAQMIWRRKTVGNFEVQLAIIQTVLTLLEKAQESRHLSGDELEFRRSLKMKILKLVTVQKARARQHSRLVWMRLGDTNTKKVHLMANNRRRNFFIRSLVQDGRLLISQEDKLHVAHHHFTKVIGRRGTRQSVVRWGNLGYSLFELSDLDVMINEDEIKNVVMEMHSEKAPGPRWFYRDFL